MEEWEFREILGLLEKQLRLLREIRDLLEVQNPPQTFPLVVSATMMLA